VRWIVVSFVTVAILIGAYTGIMHLVRQHVTSLIKTSEQKRLPAFTLTAVDGKQWTSESLHGRTVVLNFFRSKCANCVQERDAIHQLAKEVDAARVLVLGVMMDRVQGYPEAVTRSTLARLAYQHPVLMADKRFVEAFHGVGWSHVTPVTYVANPKGVIVRALRGRQDLATLRAAIR
jgi:peroxiredoxin